MIKNVYEVLDEFSRCSTKQERISVLKGNATQSFLQVLRYTYDPQYKFYVTEFPSNYIKPDTFPGIRYAGIESEIKRAYLFLKGNPTADKLSEQKRNQLLVQLLESFEPREAEIYINMMKKDLKTPYLTRSLIKETFPNLIK